MGEIEVIRGQFDEIKNDTSRNTRKLKGLGEILARAYKLDPNMADQMWDYLITVNSFNDIKNAKFYIAQIFTKILSLLAEKDAVDYIYMNHERVYWLIIYGYDSMKLFENISVIMSVLRKEEKYSLINQLLDYYYEKIKRNNPKKYTLIDINYIFQDYLNASDIEMWEEIKKNDNPYISIYGKLYISTITKKYNTINEDLAYFFEGITKVEDKYVMENITQIFEYYRWSTDEEFLKEVVKNDNLNISVYGKVYLCISMQKISQDFREWLPYMAKNSYYPQCIMVLWSLRNKLTEKEVIYYFEQTLRDYMPNWLQIPSVDSAILDWFAIIVCKSEYLLERYYSSDYTEDLHEKIFKIWYFEDNWENFEKYVSLELRTMHESRYKNCVRYLGQRIKRFADLDEFVNKKSKIIDTLESICNNIIGCQAEILFKQFVNDFKKYADTYKKKNYDYIWHVDVSLSKDEINKLIMSYKEY